MRRFRLAALAGRLALGALLAPGGSHAASDWRSRLLSDPPPVTQGIPGAPVPSGPAPLAFAMPYVEAPRLGVSISGGSKGKPSSKSGADHSTAGLTSERAQALLRSATYPGWGQATLGHSTAGAVFASIEVGILASFVAFNIQEQMRYDSAVKTAQIFAGVNLNGKDDEFQKIVGSYASSDEYNRLVVYRDAANLYYNDPVQYRAYIAEHSLGGDLAWSWQDQASFDRYGAQRKDAHRASLRANTSLALMVANRLASVLHVVLISGRAPESATGLGGWNLEVAPAGGSDPTAVRCDVRASF